MFTSIHPGKVYDLQVSAKQSSVDNWFTILYKDIIWESHAENTIVVEHGKESIVVEYNSMRFVDQIDALKDVETK